MGRKRNVEPITLGELERASKAFNKSEQARDEAILRAHLAGNGLRAIALASGLSHESVRTIIARARAWVKWEESFLAAGLLGGMTVDSQRRAEASQRKRSAHLAWLLDVKKSDRVEDA